MFIIFLSFLFSLFCNPPFENQQSISHKHFGQTRYCELLSQAQKFSYNFECPNHDSYSTEIKEACTASRNFDFDVIYPWYSQYSPSRNELLQIVYTAEEACKEFLYYSKKDKETNLDIYRPIIAFNRCNSKPKLDEVRHCYFQIIGTSTYREPFYGYYFSNRNVVCSKNCPQDKLTCKINLQDDEKDLFIQRLIKFPANILTQEHATTAFSRICQNPRINNILTSSITNCECIKETGNINTTCKIEGILRLLKIDRDGKTTELNNCKIQ